MGVTCAGLRAGLHVQVLRDHPGGHRPQGHPPGAEKPCSCCSPPCRLQPPLLSKAHAAPRSMPRASLTAVRLQPSSPWLRKSCHAKGSAVMCSRLTRLCVCAPKLAGPAHQLDRGPRPQAQGAARPDQRRKEVPRPAPQGPRRQQGGGLEPIQAHVHAPPGCPWERN